DRGGDAAGGAGIEDVAGTRPAADARAAGLPIGGADVQGRAERTAAGLAGARGDGAAAVRVARYGPARVLPLAAGEPAEPDAGAAADAHGVRDGQRAAVDFLRLGGAAGDLAPVGVRRRRAGRDAVGVHRVVCGADGGEPAGHLHDPPPGVEAAARAVVDRAG